MRTSVLSMLAGAAIAIAPAPLFASDLLITPEEASLPAPADRGLALRGITRGPAVEQVSPDPNDSIASPVPLKIRFQPRNNVPIDPDSVKLTYVRTPSVDLTERIKKHLTPEGIDMKGAVVPPGTHIIRVELRDQQGRTSTATIKLSVAK